MPATFLLVNPMTKLNYRSCEAHTVNWRRNAHPDVAAILRTPTLPRFCATGRHDSKNAHAAALPATGCGALRAVAAVPACTGDRSGARASRGTFQVAQHATPQGQAGRAEEFDRDTLFGRDPCRRRDRE